MEIHELLQSMAAAYHRKNPRHPHGVIQFEIDPPGEKWHMNMLPGQEPRLQQGKDPHARFTIITSSDILTRLYNGELAPLTAAGRARMRDPAPLDFRLEGGLSLTPEIYAEIIAFVQRFFNVSTPERILLGREHTRRVHGGDAIALYYHPGFRSAWYTLRKGEHLNEPGDTNPFPQAFIFLAGHGRARIGDEEINVEPDQAFYIPPGTEHIVWSESDEPLTLIFLAWGEGA
jgi:mannose-6-phosphate isomerase-like protein (cupin superfamily)